MNKPVDQQTLAAVSGVNSAEGVPHVLTAISAVMAALSKEGIAKGRDNQQQNYKFRGIDDVYNALSPILADNALVITPRCVSRQKEVVQSNNGKPLFYVTVQMEFELASARDGSTTTASMFGEAMDSADKATNKAMSAAYKYMAMQVFCIPTEGDNDPDATTHQLAGVEERAISHLRSCAIDRTTFAGAWEKNKADWRGVLDDAAWGRVKAEMSRLAKRISAEEEAKAAAEPKSAPHTDPDANPFEDNARS